MRVGQTHSHYRKKSSESQREINRIKPLQWACITSRCRRPLSGSTRKIIEAWDQGSVFWSVHRRWNLGGQCNKMAGRSVWGNLLLPCRHSRTIYPRDIESLPFFGGLQLFSQWVGSHRVEFNFGKWQVLFEGQGQQIASPVRETSRSMGVRGHRLHHSKRTLHMHGWVSIYIFLCVCLNLNV